MAIDIMYECIQMDELDATYKHIILVYTKYGLWINRYELLGMSTILKMKKNLKHSYHNRVIKYIQKKGMKVNRKDI